MALMQRHFKSGAGKRWWQWRALADRRDGREPSYVPPEEEPDDPPVGEPEPPVDTPEDPDTGNPEPGVDPDFAEPTRIDLEDGKQTVVRTEAEPNTWGSAYVATPADGYDYWEVHVDASTPVNATLAIGITNLDMPLNGTPGDLAGTAAYWSTGVVQINDVDTAGFATYARRDKIMIARDRVTGRVWFGKDGVWLGSAPVVGGAGHQATLLGDGPYYPFVALYSSGSKITFKFITSKFEYTAPTGFYPLGKTPPALTLPTDLASGGTTADLAVTTDEGEGTLYWVASTSSTAPTKAQVKAGQMHTGAAAADSGSQAVTVTGVQDVDATGLTDATAYTAHFMHEDAVGNQSEVVSGDGFTTGVSATAPAQFAGGDWSVADAGTSGDIVVTIASLPDDGGSSIVDIEFDVDADDDWDTIGGAVAGDYPLSGFTDDVEVDIRVRAVNAVGAGTASTSEAVTPTAPATLAMIDSVASDAAAVCPTVNAGDLIVFFEVAQQSTGSPAAHTIPADFTNILTTVFDFGIVSRITISRKIAVGDEGGTAFDAMNASTNNGHAILIFRGSSAVSSVTVHSTAQQGTSSNPTPQVVSSGSGTPPLIVLAGFFSGGTTLTPSVTPAADGVLDTGSSDLMIAYKVYNSSPADVTVDMNDLGNANQMLSCYIQVTLA